MRPTVFLLLLFISITSCIDKNPELDPEKHREEQQEYEAQKKELLINNEQFIADNKDILIKRLEILKKIQDSTFTFDGIEIDSTYRLDTVKMHLLNTQISTHQNNHLVTYDDNEANMVFTPVEGDPYSSKKYNIPFEGLYDCIDDFEKKCSDIDPQTLQNLLNTKYAVLIDQMLIIEPSFEDAETFNSGVFIAHLNTYDLVNDKPLAQFSILAQSSDEISYYETGYTSDFKNTYLENDFHKNINKEINKILREHFNIVR